MLLPLLDPAHRASSQSGQEGNQQVFGVNVSLGAEASAHIKSYAADARFGLTAGERPPLGERSAPPVSRTRW